MWFFSQVVLIFLFGVAVGLSIPFFRKAARFWAGVRERVSSFFRSWRVRSPQAGPSAAAASPASDAPRKTKTFEAAPPPAPGNSAPSAPASNGPSRETPKTPPKALSVSSSPTDREDEGETPPASLSLPSALRRVPPSGGEPRTTPEAEKKKKKKKTPAPAADAKVPCAVVKPDSFDPNVLAAFGGNGGGKRGGNGSAAAVREPRRPRRAEKRAAAARKAFREALGNLAERAGESPRNNPKTTVWAIWKSTIGLSPHEKKTLDSLCDAYARTLNGNVFLSDIEKLENGAAWMRKRWRL